MCCGWRPNVVIFAQSDMIKPAANSSALLTREYALVDRSVKAASINPGIFAYLADSLAVDLLSAASRLCPQEECHLIRGRCVR